MADSDFEWDADEIDDEKLDKLLEQAATKKKKGNDSEDESDHDSEEERKKEEALEAARAKIAAGQAKSKAKAGKTVVDETLLDAKAEKARRQKLVELADARLADDLFSGCDKPEEDVALAKKAAAEEAAAEAKAAKAQAEKSKVIIKDLFDGLELKTQADVEALSSTCVEKLSTGKAKGGAQRFLLELLKVLGSSLDTQELTNFTKTLGDLAKAKQVEKTAAASEKKKGNEKSTKNTKFDTHGEMDLMYGGGGADWEDWDEDWEEFDGKAKK